MNLAAPQEIKLSEYQRPVYTTEEVALTFDITEGETIVRSVLKIRRQQEGSALYLNGEGLELLGLEVDGRELADNEYQVTADGMTLFGLGEAHEISITTKIFPEKNTALEGLYRSRRMYCTQCEAQGFRKITYYQDRPDVLARFKTTIRADASYPTLLSNGNLIASTTMDDGRREVSWQDPFPKPSYLFALVAGDLEMVEDQFVTMSGRPVTLQIFSENHNIGQCGYAMDVLKRSMRWDEKQYGREYDLDIFMIVAVEDFNMGAMENKGLNIFNTSCVLASPDTATDAAHLRVEAVVAHEYFHNWSGNRVTCRDWFQLSLKEGFTVLRDADFSGDMNSHAVKRIEDVSFLRSVQFAEDSGPLAHPVRPQSYIEISNFYTTTIYEKGAEVVRMYRTLLGPEKFRAATDLYFDRHDGQAATTDDFTRVMEEVGGCDLSQFKRWYDQAGTPILEVTEAFDSNTLSLTIKQSCPSTPNQAEKLPFHMPVEIGLLDAEGEALPVFDLQIDSNAAVRPIKNGLSILVELTEEQTTLEFSYLDEQPHVSFLREFSAPVRVVHPRAEEKMGFLALHDVDGFVRWDSLQTLWLNYFKGDSTFDISQLLGQIAELSGDLATAEEKQLAATMLVVPEANYLFEQIAGFNVDAILTARASILHVLADAHKDAWQNLYQCYAPTGVYSPDGQGMADRALRNTAFAHLSRGLSGDALTKLVTEHYSTADNLTDRRAALSAALNTPGFDPTAKQHLLQDFYDKWQKEALVIDLWYSLQAQSELTDVSRLRELEQLESFEMTNPNRARSLYAAFGMYNHRRFHALDGSGYEYLGDSVSKFDELNPQLAARLATPLTRWARYDAPRRALMREQLQKLANKENLSKDLFEIVTKALGD